MKILIPFVRLAFIIVFVLWFNITCKKSTQVHPEEQSAGNVLPGITIPEAVGYHFVEKIETGSDLDYILAFENEQAQRKLVCWTTPQNRDDTPEKARLHPVNISLETSSTSVFLYDINGNENLATVDDGKITMILSGSPQYVEITD